MTPLHLLLLIGGFLILLALASAIVYVVAWMRDESAS